MREPSAAEEYDLDGKYDLLLEPPHEPSRKPSIQWLAAFKKVIAILFSDSVWNFGSFFINMSCLTEEYQYSFALI